MSYQSLGKTKIAVDTASLADGDSIASYLVDAAGNLITSTLIGSKQRLDVQSSAEYPEDSVHASGDYGQFIMGVRNDAGTPLAADGDYIPFMMDSSGRLMVNANLSANFDFVYAEDSSHVSGDQGAYILAVRQDVLANSTSADGDYGSFKINQKGELYVTDSDAIAQLVLANASLDNIESSVAAIDVDTTNIYNELVSLNASTDNIESDVDAIRVELLDQGTTLDSILSEFQGLTHDEDSVHVSGHPGVQSLAVRKDAYGSNVSADGDYASFLQWGNGEMKVVDTNNGSMLQQQIAVGTSAIALPASALAFRKSLLIQNQSNKSIYIGSASVTTSGATAGIEIPKWSFMELDVGPAVSVYAIAGSAGNNVNVLELA